MANTSINFLEQSGTPAAVPTGYLGLFVDSSGTVQTINSSGTLAPVGGGSPPGGATTQIQYNNAGAFTGDAGLTYNLTGSLFGHQTVVIGDGTGNTSVTFNAGGTALEFYNQNGIRMVSSGGLGSSGDIVSLGTGNLFFEQAGSMILYTTGANAMAGTGTFAAGVATIANTLIVANSVVMIQITALGTVTVPSATLVTVTAGTGFTVTSANAIDTSTFVYHIVSYQ